MVQTPRAKMRVHNSCGCTSTLLCLTFVMTIAAAAVLPVGAQQTAGGRASGRGEEEGKFFGSSPSRPTYNTVAKPYTPSYAKPSYYDYEKEKAPFIECGKCNCECNNELNCMLSTLSVFCALLFFLLLATCMFWF